ncbi:prolyl-tRNA synthetase associated domain-containing protein [Isobaculum melis]|uniref:Ala-tRNA(Pro) deacylase n=1 Tax=Isobaculum melis TaxID=142588 RepID=A0A1H9QJE8_9LACT|nr:prolyl-tRNA synthetase associated domain-containing protein [Isobaculum melis]SER59883.1 Ala-tRNA(Pro) deacylase [Isobaculum melis]
MKQATEEKAYQVLSELTIPYHRVDHEPIFSVKEYEVELPGPQVKNLLLKAKKGKQYYLVLIHEEKQVDLKKLAEELGVNRLSFASSDELRMLLGLQSGMLNPLALTYDEEHLIKVVIDRAIDHSDTIGVHPNINTTTLMIQFSDFKRFLQAYEYEPIYLTLS